MKRRSFLRNILLGITGTLLCPKDIFSTPTSDKKNKLVKVDFKPNYDSDDKEIPNDLIKFAKHFSENYKIISCGTYVSDCNKYRIDYVDQIKDRHSGQIENTPYRVGHSTGIMEFSKTKMVDMSPSVIFNAVIWCYVMYKEPRDYYNADIKSIQCSIENGFSKKEVFIHHINMFKGSGTDLNMKRAKALYDHIKNTNQIN